MCRYIYSHISSHVIIYIVKICCVLFGDEGFLEIMMWRTVYKKLTSNILFCCRSVATCSHGFEAQWGTLALGNFGSGWQYFRFLLPFPWRSGTSQVSRPPLLSSQRMLFIVFKLFLKAIKINCWGCGGHRLNLLVQNKPFYVFPHWLFMLRIENF